jgi:CBS domain-containing protein
MPGKKCSDVMTNELTCCLPRDTVNLAAQSMKAQDIGAVPVMTVTRLEIAGIVTDRDLALKVVAEGLDPGKSRLSK